MTKLLTNTLYKDFNYDNFFFTDIDGLNFPFNSTWKRVGVNISGGADSALLAFVICKIIEQKNLDCKIDAISFIRCWNSRPWQSYISNNVFLELKNMFPTIVNKRHFTFIPPEIEYGNIGSTIVTKHYDEPLAGDAIIISSYNSYIAYNKKLNAVFNGITSTPSNVADIPGRTVDEKNAKLNELIIYKKTINSFLIRPFKYIQKDWILQQYVNFNILNLYKKTRSCEGDINLNHKIQSKFKSFTDYQEGMPVPICNECDWCKERAWAEKQVGLINE